MVVGTGAGDVVGTAVGDVVVGSEIQPRGNAVVVVAA